MTRKEQLSLLNSTKHKIETLGLNLVKVDPWVPVNIGDKTYRLEFSYGAVIEVFQKTGIAIGVESVQPNELLKPGVLPVLLLAGLRTHHSDEFGNGVDLDAEPELQRDLMRRIPMRHLNYYSTVIGMAIAAVEPDPEEMAEITDALNGAEDTQLPLALNGTFSGSGHSAENTDSPIPISGV